MNFENPFDNKSEQQVNVDLLLEEIYNKDIFIRDKIGQYLSLEDKDRITKRNTDELVGVIKKVGWDEIFKTVDRIQKFWLIAQHTNHNIDLQEEFLFNFYKRKEELIKKNKEFEKVILMAVGMLRDRFLVGKYGWQVYGSQFDEEGKLFPILKDGYLNLQWEINSFEKDYFLDLNNKKDLLEIQKRRIENGFNPELKLGDGKSLADKFRKINK